MRTSPRPNVTNGLAYLIPVVANSVTNVPPPELANPAPNDAVDGSMTTHPSLSLAL